MGTVRFLLALCVVASHSPGSNILGFKLYPGTTAVQCFYVVSGFLITMVLNERAEYRDLRNFYISRYLRLWPAYVVVAVAALAFVRWDAMIYQLPKLVDWPGLAFIWFANLTLLFQDWFLFLRYDGGYLAWTAHFNQSGPQVHSALLVPQAWTLGIELAFYALAPFVCRHWWRLVIMCTASLAIRAFIASHDPQIDPWMYRFAPSEMVLFGAGGLAYFAGRFVLQASPQITRAVGALCLAAFLVVVFGPLHQHQVFFRGLTFLNWPIILLIIASAGPLYYAFRNSWIDSNLGELSYPLYLSHIFVASIIAKMNVPASWQVGNLLYVVVTIVTSLLLLVLVIEPVNSLRKRFGARHRPTGQDDGKILVAGQDVPVGAVRE